MTKKDNGFDITSILIKIKDEEQKKKKIIEDAEQGILPDDEARIIYLDYLKKEKKFSFKKTINIFKQSHEDNIPDRGIMVRNFNFLGGPIVFGFILGLLSISSTIISSKISNIFQKILNSYFDGSFNTAWHICLKIFLGTALIPSAVSLLWPVVTYLLHLIINTIKHLKNKKFIKHKIKKLREELKHNKTESIAMDVFDKTLDLDKQVGKINEYKCHIYSKANELMQTLEYVNLNDKKELLTELKSILNDYDTEIEKYKDLNSVSDLSALAAWRLEKVETKMTRAMNGEKQKNARMLLEGRNPSIISTGRTRTKEYK